MKKREWGWFQLMIQTPPPFPSCSAFVLKTEEGLWVWEEDHRLKSHLLAVCSRLLQRLIRLNAPVTGACLCQVSLQLSEHTRPPPPAPSLEIPPLTSQPPPPRGDVSHGNWINCEQGLMQFEEERDLRFVGGMGEVQGHFHNQQDENMRCIYVCNMKVGIT